MPAIDPTWTYLEATSNADLYEIAPDVLAIVPHVDAIDSEATARASVQWQHRHWLGLGRRGAVVVFMDDLLDQESGARAVYVNEANPDIITCYALVGSTGFSQAVSAVFTGLARPQVPTAIFSSLAEAMPWIAQMNQTRGGDPSSAKT